MYKLLILLVAAMIAASSYGQNYRESFSKLLTQKDTTGQRLLLQKWETASPDDAELYVAYFNYYYSLSKRNILHLNKEVGSKAQMKLLDSTGATAGFLSESVNYDEAILAKGFEHIDAGINKYPARLDMRFGKTYVLGQLGNYEAFAAEIIRAIDYSKSINHQWTWNNNQKLKDPEEFLLSTVQKYVVQLYNAGDEQLDRMKSISETVLKYYPDHVESLSNLSIVYSLKNDHDAALACLLKAEKIAPTDFIILNNIANAYDKKGDKENAIRYYELTIKHGDDEAKEFAKQRIKKLRGN
jgi:tetratricopeptide (TPR) repeat protein